MSYRIFKEDDKSLHMLHPDGSTFQVAKKALDEDTIKYIKSKIPLHMDEGGFVPDDYKNKFLSQLGSGGVLGTGNPLAALAATDLSSQAPAEPVAAPAPIPAIGGVEATPPVNESPPVIEPGATAKAPTASVGNEEDNAGEPIRLRDINAAKPPKDPLAQYGILATAQGEVAGINQKAKAEADQAKANADAIKAHIQKTEIQEAEYQARHDFQQAKYEQAKTDFANGKLDPYRVWNNASTGNKILAGIGMLLSGLGAGRDGHNLASDSIQRAIDKDIESQKADILKNKDLANMSETEIKNLEQWQADKRTQALAAVDTIIKQNAANAGTPIALAQAKILTNQVNQKAGEEFRKYAATAASLQGADPLTYKINTQLPKEQIGDAIKEQGTLNETRTAINSANDIFSELHHLQTLGHLASPQHHKKADILYARLMGAVMKAIDTKKFPNEKTLESVVKPYFTSVTDTKETEGKKMEGFIKFIKSNAPPTPILSGRCCVSQGVTFN